MALYHHTPYVIMVWCLVKHKDNLTFLPVGKHPLGRPRRRWDIILRLLGETGHVSRMGETRNACNLLAGDLL